MATYRRLLRSGDLTSANGVLIASGDLIRGDVRVAVEGDYATCPACGSGGVVYNTCRPTFRQCGRRVLVHGAYVDCQCKIKPSVLASSGALGIEVDSVGFAMPDSEQLGDIERAAVLQALGADMRRVRDQRVAQNDRDISCEALDNMPGTAHLMSGRAVHDGLMRIKAVTLKAEQEDLPDF